MSAETPYRLFDPVTVHFVKEWALVSSEDRAELLQCLRFVPASYFPERIYRAFSDAGTL